MVRKPRMYDLREIKATENDTLARIFIKLNDLIWIKAVVYITIVWYKDKLTNTRYQNRNSVWLLFKRSLLIHMKKNSCPLILFYQVTRQVSLPSFCNYFWSHIGGGSTNCVKRSIYYSGQTKISQFQRLASILVLIDLKTKNVIRLWQKYGLLIANLIYFKETTPATLQWIHVWIWSEEERQSSVERVKKDWKLTNFQFNKYQPWDKIL